MNDGSMVDTLLLSEDLNSTGVLKKLIQARSRTGRRSSVACQRAQEGLSPGVDTSKRIVR